MNFKQINSKVIIRIDKGEELVTTLKTICKKLDIKFGSIVGIGATDKATIGLFNTKTKKYQSKEFIGDHEIASLVGNVSTMNGEVYLHLHIIICNVENEAMGGHLSSAIISATFEGIINLIDEQVIREHDGEVGINQLKLF